MEEGEAEEAQSSQRAAEAGGKKPDHFWKPDSLHALVIYSGPF